MPVSLGLFLSPPAPPLRTKQQQRYPKDGEKKEEAQAGQNSV